VARAVRIWDVGASEIATHTLHNQNIMALRFLPDNRILAGCDLECLSLWQWRTESTPRVVQRDPYGARNDIILTSSPDGQLISSKALTDTVIVVDCTGNLCHTICTGNYIYGIAISPDKEWLATVNNDNILLFDLKSGELRRNLKKGGYNYGRIAAFSPDGQLLASADDREIILWDPCPEKASGPPHRMRRRIHQWDQ
jgi:WD40 repeat protein